MNHGTKNKLLTWLVLLLLVANAATLTLFWIGAEKHPSRQKGTPAEFLIRELKLDDKQQDQLEILRAEHKNAAVSLRKQLREAKEPFFALIKQSNVTDSVKQAAERSVSFISEKLDLLALNHFIKVRAICTTEQQKKFDNIIEQVTEMISKAGEPPPQEGNQPPPRNDVEGHRPPPPGSSHDDGPPPPQNN